MRLLMINLLAASLVLFSAGFASAYEIRLVATTPTDNVEPGDLVSYDYFLDTQGESNITLISVSVTFDPNVVTYRGDLSEAEDYYPLYSPGQTGKGGFPSSYLVPVNNPPVPWPAPPPGLEQINFDFTEVNLAATRATATNQFLGRIVLEATGDPGSSTAIGFGLDNGGNVFQLGDFSVINDQVSVVNANPAISIVPEPTTALLVGLGLVGLGVAGRRRA